MFSTIIVYCNEVNQTKYSLVPFISRHVKRLDRAMSAFNVEPVTLLQ